MIYYEVLAVLHLEGAMGPTASGETFWWRQIFKMIKRLFSKICLYMLNY